eukprot:sb/3470340/
MQLKARAIIRGTCEISPAGCSWVPREIQFCTCNARRAFFYSCTDFKLFHPKRYSATFIYLGLFINVYPAAVREQAREYKRLCQRVRESQSTTTDSFTQLCSRVITPDEYRNLRIGYTHVTSTSSKERSRDKIKGTKWISVLELVGVWAYPFLAVYGYSGSRTVTHLDSNLQVSYCPKIGVTRISVRKIFDLLLGHKSRYLGGQKLTC